MTRRAPKSVVATRNEVVAVRDYLGQIRTAKDGHKTQLALPKSDVLGFELASGCRVIARPSGTEPKAKFYFDVREAMSQGEPLSAAEARATAKGKQLAESFVAIATPDH